MSAPTAVDTRTTSAPTPTSFETVAEVIDQAEAKPAATVSAVPAVNPAAADSAKPQAAATKRKRGTRPTPSMSLEPPSPPADTAPSTSPEIVWPKDLPLAPEWLNSAAGQYWATSTLGVGGRPAPGTRLAITSLPSYSGTATHGVVISYDGRWKAAQFPVRLYACAPDGTLSPTGLTLDYWTSPRLGDSDLDIQREYQLVGCSLTDGKDIIDGHLDQHQRGVAIKVTLVAGGRP